MMQVVRPRYSVLITDDDEQSRLAIRDGLRAENYKTLLASCGREAIEIVRNELVHVMILDMHMPDMTGIETLELMEQIVEAPPPCILISGDVSKELKIRAMMARAHTVLQKPLRLDIVRMVLSELIKRYYPNDA